ncbi:serine-rich coiled-coil domain-containing protein 2 isoform X2 [Latimeria chalumnae]|uniref:serine-rich coiled-coil domain-containing protein 2 isoform X2 n=1 Tax=Latimeria chalumnae TaxID=7897 RepID=UPI0006D8EA25|nr:PREDICTED: serine-rich coiled-coil domain-containing protein 2 isoform X2 [Latimeria chalumnae]|eukprot:XP_014350345.1 PREDICTED: serine-rich coiled-coil domain-containing protein 2 isoform X2 [Latimeria chalumnae]
MEECVQSKSTLVSRLPKFGGAKPGGTSLQPTQNGACVSVSGAPNNNSSSKNSGKKNITVHKPAFSFNWKKSNKALNGGQSIEDAGSSEENLVSNEKCPQTSGGFAQAPLEHGLKATPSAIVKTTKLSGTSVSSTDNSNGKLVSGMPNAAKNTKGMLRGRISYTGHNLTKPYSNGLLVNKTVTGLQRPKTNFGFIKSSSKESLVPSIGSASPLYFETIVRSQSFSHSNQKSLPSSLSMTRSYSFNKAVDLTRSCQNQQLRTRVPQKPSLLFGSTRAIERPNAVELNVKNTFSRPCLSAPLLNMKKSLLPNCTRTTSSLGYRMTHPSLLKANRPLFGRKVIVDGNRNPATNEKPKETDTAAGDTVETKQEGISMVEKTTSPIEEGHTMQDNVYELESKDKYLSDDVDEISISSMSSCDKIDQSEEYTFVDVEDMSKSFSLEQQETDIKKNGDAVAPTVELPDMLKETPSSDCKITCWIENDLLSPGQDLESSQNTSGNDLISPDVDYHIGSSLELSPSDSSGGTYMWDEEGMEPLGTVHPCGSYESSDLNSMDILKNLESFDLEDDDLMLDVDLPEDMSFDSVTCESMTHLERPEKCLRQQQQGFWRRRPHHWSGQEHYHLSNSDLNRIPGFSESPTAHLEDYGSPSYLRAPQTSHTVVLQSSTVKLDEMTLRHMVQDCTAVKTQLFKLKRMLQQSDGSTSVQDLLVFAADAPNSQEACSPTDDTKELLNEIKRLKEEMKKKDDALQQLQQQLTTPCNCHKENKNSQGERHLHNDKSTQTFWRGNSGGFSAPSFTPWQGSLQGNPRIGPPHRRQSEFIPLTPLSLCTVFSLKYYCLPATLSASQTTSRENN